MAIEIGPVYRQDLPVAPNVEAKNPPLVKNILQPDYPALLKKAQEKTYSLKPVLSLENRPLEPLEPAPFTATADEWNRYVLKRNAARAYEAEHSLRGVPFS